MRINIEIDNSLMKKTNRITKKKPKKEIIDLALRTYKKVNERKKILNLFGKIEWVGDLNQMRKA